MAQLWFLDLDGAKSGPYQTPEVLNLIAEGEVLPHHRIATSLKEAEWSSVLEWRLEQAKLDPNYKVPTPAPAVESTVVFESKREIPEKKSPPPLTTPEPSPPVRKLENLFQEEKPLPPPHTQGGPSEPASPSKRDPMAEMFDMLQKTKQKREEKQIQTAQAQAQQVSHTHTSQKNSDTPFLGGHWKTIAMAAGITLVGFLLGQWFQKSAPPAPQVATSTPTPAKEASPAPEEAAQEKPTENKENVMVDRSTDKITIRGKAAVQNKPAAITPPPALAKDAKDLKELQDLKTELLEIKKLKDQLKNSMSGDDTDGFEPGDAGVNGVPDESQPQQPYDPNNPNGQQPMQPHNIANPDVHY